MNPLSPKQLNEARAARLIEQRRVYRSTMLNEAGRLRGDPELMLKDLKQFCYIKKSTAKVSPVAGLIDTHAMAIAEGRREVYLRIEEMLEISDDAFNKMIEQLTHNQEEE